MACATHTTSACTHQWRSSSTQSKMRLMTSGGFLRAFNDVMSFGEMEFKAARAASKAGFAAARSLQQRRGKQG